MDTFTNGAQLRLNWNQAGYNLALTGSYQARAKWEPWGDPATSGFDPDQKTYWKYSAELTKGFYFARFRKLLVKLSYLDGTRLDRFSQWDFGPFGSTTLHGFPGGSVRADRAVLANVSYGLNIENVVRFEVFYDQASSRTRSPATTGRTSRAPESRRPSTARGTTRASGPRSVCRSCATA